jgi:excisionase family DNA binding protein
MTIHDILTQRKRAMTADEVAELLNVHAKTVYRAARAGTLPSFHVFSCRRFDPKAVAQWLQERSA